MILAVYRGGGKREGGHSTPRRQVPNVGVRFSGLGTHGETVGFREEFRTPVGVRKSPRNEPAGRPTGGRYGELWLEDRVGVPGCCPIAA
jgi:hypothetical protein